MAYLVIPKREQHRLCASVSDETKLPVGLECADRRGVIKELGAYVKLHCTSISL
jgi:hypothetical protein